jgi:hypothetical protein
MHLSNEAAAKFKAQDSRQTLDSNRNAENTQNAIFNDWLD